jgi:hypothetical protein
MIVVHNALEPAFFETVSEYALNQKYCHEQLLLSSVSEQKGLVDKKIILPLLLCHHIKHLFTHGTQK